MKGQAALMEYMVFILLVMFIIGFVLLMVFGFQFLSLGSEYSGEMESKSLFILQSLLSSKTLNSPQYQKGSVLDDSVLTVMTCDDITEMFGEDVYVEIRTFMEKPSCEDLANYWEIRDCEDRVEEIVEMESRECTDVNYPDCGTWNYQDGQECDREERMIYRSVPVNVFRKMNKTVSLGVITVGIRGNQ